MMFEEMPSRIPHSFHATIYNGGDHISFRSVVSFPPYTLSERAGRIAHKTSAESDANVVSYQLLLVAAVPASQLEQ